MAEVRPLSDRFIVNCGVVCIAEFGMARIASDPRRTFRQIEQLRRCSSSSRSAR